MAKVHAAIGVKKLFFVEFTFVNIELGAQW
jgi:hypothetical protein